MTVKEIKKQVEEINKEGYNFSINNIAFKYCNIKFINGTANEWLEIYSDNSCEMVAYMDIEKVENIELD